MSIVQPLSTPAQFTIKSPGNYIQQAGLVHQVGERIRPLVDHLRILTSPQA